MKQLNGVTKIMFGVVAILLIVTVALGVATVAKESKNRKENPASDPKQEVTEKQDKTPTGAVDATEAPLPTETSTPTPVPTNVPKHKVAIDPGQQRKEDKEKEPVGPGSSETTNRMSYGATSVTSDIREHEWNLIMANLIKTELEARGYEVYMTRETADVNISNGERAVLANASGAEILVGIQADSSDNRDVKGIYTQLPTNSNPYVGKLYKKSRKLAESLQEAVIQATKGNDRGYQEKDKWPIINYSEIPVCVMQLGFMSNKEEDTNLQNDEYRKTMAIAICDGIEAYFKLMDEE